MSNQLVVKSGNNYRVSNAGPMHKLSDHEFKLPDGNGGIVGKLFLHEPLKLTGMEVSLNRLPAGEGMPFYHTHKQQEELYIFVGGQGQFQIDNDTFDVSEGSVVSVQPDGVRTWRNNSSEDLYYIVVQAKIGSINGGTISDGTIVDKAVEWAAD